LQNDKIIPQQHDIILQEKKMNMRPMIDEFARLILPHRKGPGLDFIMKLNPA
jgi:hypothetical protein